MIRTLLRPNLIKRFNIRTKCDLNCKESVNLMSQQVQSLNTISKQTEIITIITVVNFIAPIVLIGATLISRLI